MAKKTLEELRSPPGPLVPPLVPDEGPVVGRPPPLPKVAGMVPADPPLVAALPARALPQIAAANICKALHELHLDVWSRRQDEEATCWLGQDLELRQEQKWLRRK